MTEGGRCNDTYYSVFAAGWGRPGHTLVAKPLILSGFFFCLLPDRTKFFSPDLASFFNFPHNFILPPIVVICHVRGLFYHSAAVI